MYKRQAKDCVPANSPYNVEKDITFFEGLAETYIAVKPGMFAIFFPHLGETFARLDAGRRLRGAEDAQPRRTESLIPHHRLIAAPAQCHFQRELGVFVQLRDTGRILADADVSAWEFQIPISPFIRVG